MTASQAVAPGATDIDTPTPGTADEPEEHRRRKAVLLLFLLGALIALLALTVWYLLFRQPLTTLPIVPNATMPAYATSVYGADRPFGVAVTPAGDRIFVAQTNSPYGVLILDPSGNQVGTFATPPGSSHVPVYVAINPVSQEVFVSDRPAGAVWVYDANGTYLRQFVPTTAITGWQPLGLAFDQAGNLYVTDVGAQPQVVEVFDSTAGLIRTVGAEEAMSFPNGVAVDDAGTTYVTDGNNGRLLAFGPDGQLVSSIGRGVGDGNLGLPRGVAVSGDRVYVTDNTGQTVFVYGRVTPDQPRFEFIGSFGSQGIENGQFEFPNGIAVDGRARLYVSDSANDRVQVWSY
jgi:DNA-binding beta-propeller fold protein YncE